MKAVNRFVRGMFIIICAAAFIYTCSPFPASASMSRTENPDIVYTEDADDNPGQQLTLVSSSIMNSDRNVPLNPLIQLDFNKNVVNFVVARDNVNCFHLIDDTGNIIPINVILPDDQLQNHVKRTVFISPMEPLNPRSEYALVIDNNFMGKNGNYIDIAYKIRFTTGSQEREQGNTLLAGLGKNILSFTTDAPLNENSVPGSSRVGGRSQTPLLSKQPATFPLSENLLVAIIFLMTGIGGFLLVMGKRIKEKAMSTKLSS